MGSAEDLARVRAVIGGRIKARRMELRDQGKPWSQRAIAERAEIDLDAFRKIENKKSLPRVDRLIRIAGALQLPPDDLIGGLRWIPDENPGFGRMEGPER